VISTTFSAVIMPSELPEPQTFQGKQWRLPDACIANFFATFGLYRGELPVNSLRMTRGQQFLSRFTQTWTRRIITWLVLSATTAARGQTNDVAMPAEIQPTNARPNLPTLFIAGDSTAANGSAGAIGWGRFLGDFFDPARIRVLNRAIGGRSSRTFVTEGAWDRLAAEIKPGDYVLIQFGQNDGGAVNDTNRARGSLPGIGDDTQEIDNLITEKHEVVHTFGWYVRKMVTDTQAKGAHPIVLSLTVRNIWRDGHVERGSGNFGAWARAVALSNHVAFVDVTSLIADRYEQMGQTNVAPLFPRDHTHTSADGAQLNARLVVSGIKGLRDNSLNRCLSAAGRLVSATAPDAVRPARPGPRGNPNDPDPIAWLNLAEPGDPRLPSVFLIGDSTVRNGRGNGYDGQWGWGDAFEAYFDPARINVVNRAVGGTGARTFITSGYWDRTLAMLKPGDVVLMQFGTNDNGQRGALRGVGEETEQRTDPQIGKTEVIHTFGWYLRKYVADARAKGATPIVCSLVPRNVWRDGKIDRPHDSHADWARTVARDEKAGFIDLYELIAKRYDGLGKPAVDALFADGRVHTTWAGAELNAACVTAGLEALPANPLADFRVKAVGPVGTSNIEH
jgi:lysophospholipase L1-like esterase